MPSQDNLLPAAALLYTNRLPAGRHGKPVAARGLVNGRGPRRKAWEG